MQRKKNDQLNFELVKVKEDEAGLWQTVKTARIQYG